MPGRFALALAGALMWLGSPSLAEARPVVHVGVAAPVMVVAPPRAVVVPQHVIVAAPPAPHYVWVEGYWTRDPYGRRVHVPGHWQAPPPPVVRVVGPPPHRGRAVRGYRR